MLSEKSGADGDLHGSPFSLSQVPLPVWFIWSSVLLQMQAMMPIDGPGLKCWRPFSISPKRVAKHSSLEKYSLR